MKEWFLVLCACAFPCVASAWEFCCPSSYCVDASIGIEALYWRPYTDDFIYGEYATTAPINRELLDLRPEYDWGFRLFANVSDKCHCNFLDFEWARITTSASEVTGPKSSFTLSQYTFAGFNVNSDVDSIDASQQTNYQKFSAKLGHRFCGDQCRFLYGYLGGRWIYINVKQNSLALDGGTSFTIQQRSWFHGGGVEAGVGGHAELWCGLGTSFRFGAIGAIGDRSFSHEANQLTVNATLADHTNRCIAGVEGRAELNYTYFCKCFWVQGQIGYEINYYLNPLLFGTGQTFPGSLFASDFGIGGLVFGLTIGY